MPTVRWAYALVCIALLAGSASAASPTTLPSQWLPTPPQQNQPWTPPKTDLPEKLVSATELLFKQGMADPRGGEYRQVTLRNEGADPEKTHGWVFTPAANGRRFAVCWDGLAYWVNSVGGPADVTADVDAVLAADRTGKYQLVQLQVIGRPLADTEFCGLNPLAVPLLMRIGQTALAEKYWQQENDDTAKAWAQQDNWLPKTLPAKPPETRPSPADMDPYPLWAEHWAMCTYCRAAVAHRAGDDRVSLALASMLTDSMAETEKHSADRHVDSPFPDRFLDPLPRLLADEKRRVAEGKVDRVLDHPGEYGDRSKRIAGLIRDLEVSAPDDYGTVDPVVAALEKEGYAAVPPLIDCLANDNRLTRCLTDDGHEEWNYWLISVRPVAYGAICDILQEKQFGPISGGSIGWDPDQREAIAQEVRDYWNKYHGLSPAERYYRILADDTADERWEDAGEWLTRMTNRQIDGWWTDGPPMLGEVLRAKRNPSVTDLLIQRAQGENSFRLALDLLRWDRTSAAPTLQLLIDRRKAVTQDSDADQVRFETATLFAALLQSGEPHAGRQYGIWICDQKACGNPVAEQLFRPIWMNPKDRDVSAAADWLFNDLASPWYCLATMKPNDIIFSPMELLTSPLISAPTFQESVVRNLQNQAVCHRMAVTNDAIDIIDSNGLAARGFNHHSPSYPLESC